MASTGLAPPPPFDLVVFGGAGDLSLRKLMPALYYRETSHGLPEKASIIGAGRRTMAREAYIAMVEESCRRYVEPACFNAETWQRFAERLDYAAVNVADAEGFTALERVLHDPAERSRSYYLALAPSLVGPTCTNLAAAGMITPLSRVVLEKPLGNDYTSARRINDEVGQVFEEDQIFRIDHYLGKETVQNLMALRFANSMFEPLWNAKYIDHVQITVAESIGVEGRHAYYDQAGAARDMLQNHMMQLLCLLAMEPPNSLDPDGVRSEKIKVLEALRPMTGSHVATHTVRGQYTKGAVGGEPVPGYAEESDSPESALTETFVAVKAKIRNWRWADVPFYLRTGKRLPIMRSEIVVQFRRVPHRMFPEDSGSLEPNRLFIRLQPDDGISLKLMMKVPGPGMRLRTEALDLDFAETFRDRNRGAYERLLGDALRGDPTLFMRRDEVDTAWAWIDPMIEAWQQTGEPPRPYAAGTWGPSAAIALIERDGRSWHEPHAD